MAVDWQWCYENPKEAAAEIERLEADNARLRAALKGIAMCESHHDGDVVDIARRALEQGADK